jgi:uncharacterized membrane protein YgcG
MPKLPRVFFILTILALVLGASQSVAKERILSYNSLVRVQQDASLIVTETIQVQAEGKRIKRGIFRTFPTTYENNTGRVKVGFQIRSVLKNGKQEPYHTKSAANGVKIYIGEKNVFLKPGVYTYQITYWTNRQVGFFAGYDELYWNVTGNDWPFTIERVQAVIELPPGAKVLQHAAYTGLKGAKGKNFSYTLDAQGRPTWTTTAPLPGGSGLTISVAWPKGLVAEPGPSQKASDWLKDNSQLVAGAIGLFLTLLYYFWAWLKVGRDPKRGVMVPLFSPPQGLSPASSRFIMKMGFDNKAFSSAVVSMAVKGFLTIKDDSDKNYTLLRSTGPAPTSLSKGENRMGSELFQSSTTLELKTKNHRRVSGAMNALKETLQEEYEKANFKTNGLYLLPGIVLCLLTLVGVVFTAPDPGGAAGISLWLTIWSLGCYFLAVKVGKAWRNARGAASGMGALGITIFATPFFLGLLAGLYILADYVTFLARFIIPVVVLITPLFAFLLKAPTQGGRRLMDRIEGFKHYLSVAEEERLNLVHPPEKTPELFERYLPYALALDVEQEWAEQFSQVLEKAGAEPYQPNWYSGNAFRSRGFGGMASSLGSSLAGAISSSSSAPGSSAGSGGGGSSGGGGGGGGGGGW